jgi:hypothetical protein
LTSTVFYSMGKATPKNVYFRSETLYRSDGHGDTLCLTWADDDNQITAMCDGDWLSDAHRDEKKRQYHNHLYRIKGDASNFDRLDIPAYPALRSGEGGWFGYGIIAVDGDLYTAASKTPRLHWSGPFRGVKLLKSSDGGQNWHRVDRQGQERYLAPDDPARHVVDAIEMFTLEEFGRPHSEQQAYPFSYFDFVQHGKNNAAAPDDFLYIYGPEGARAHELLLARVHRQKLGVRDEWQYFIGRDGERSQWSSDIEQRVPAHVFPEKNSQGHYFGWYSWLPSVVWNAGLGLYIMVNGGSYAGHGMTESDEDYYHSWMHNKTGSLGFWYAEKPCGPWREFFYTDYWTADHPDNLTYQPKLSPKWIGDSGKEMVLVWSDAMKNADGKSHTTNYTWNQMEIEIELA